MRTGKELILASKPYAKEQEFKSWWCLWSTLTMLALLFILACISPIWWIYIPCSFAVGLLLVRLFIIYHDYMHGTILRNSRVAKIIMHVYGLLALCPPDIWKHSHNDHHKNNSKWFGPVHGSFPLITIDDYANLSFWQRFAYRVSRHPLTIAFGYITAFFWALSLRNFLANPKQNYMGGVSVFAHAGLGVGLTMVSIQALFWGMVFPMLIAGSLGTYLFYAQHNFPGMRRRHGKDWDQVYAALNSSSYMRMGKLMHWFTGNIGYHHIHHLNAKIPFYRLKEAMAGIEELQSNVGTSLNPIEIIRCLRLKLWDPSTESLITFAAARRLCAIKINDTAAGSIK